MVPLAFHKCRPNRTNTDKGEQKEQSIGGNNGMQEVFLNMEIILIVELYSPERVRRQSVFSYRTILSDQCVGRVQNRQEISFAYCVELLLSFIYC